MDKATKIGIAAIILIILALLIFNPSTPEAKDAYLVCNAHNETSKGNDGYLEFICYENNTDTDVKLENVTVLVNVTYTNNTTVKYNLTTDSYGKAEIHDLSKGKYTVSANIVGENIKNTTTFTKNVKVNEYKEPSKTNTEKTKTTTEQKTEQETEYDTEYEKTYETEYDTEYETEYDTEYETYYEPEESYTVEYYWVYV